MNALILSLLILGVGTLSARTYMEKAAPLVSKTGQGCLPAGLKNLPSPTGVRTASAGCVTQVWLDAIAPGAARDFYQTHFQKIGWDVANPYSEGEKHFRFTATKRQQIAQFDFYALTNGAGTRLEISYSFPQEESARPK